MILSSFLLALPFSFLVSSIEVEVPRLSLGSKVVQVEERDLLKRPAVEMSASTLFPNGDFERSELPAFSFRLLSGSFGLEKYLNPSFGLGLSYALGKRSLPDRASESGALTGRAVDQSMSVTSAPLWIQARPMIAEFFYFSPVLRIGLNPTMAVTHDSRAERGRTEAGLPLHWSFGIVFEPRNLQPERKSGWSFLIPRGIQASYVSNHKLIGSLETEARGYELGLWMPL